MREIQWINTVLCGEDAGSARAQHGTYRSGLRNRSRSLPESVVLIGVGVGVGVGKFSSTPTPGWSRSWLQHFFIIYFLVEMETKMEKEYYVLNADSHDAMVCRVRCSYRWGCVCFRVN